nr:outer membrane beta-barrel protein [uncultured Carboxylicivirga sp.]
MKKQLLLVIITLIPMVIFAQGQTGIKVLEGNIGYSSSNDDSYNDYYNQTNEYKTQRFYINPKIGWFVSESSVLGVGIGYQFNKYESQSETKHHLFSINPYYKNYQKITDKLFFTTTVDLALGFGKESNDDDDFTENLFIYSINVRPGINYFLSEHWALKANFGSLFYQRTKEKITQGAEDHENETKSSEFGFNFNTDSFSMGVGYYF